MRHQRELHAGDVDTDTHRAVGMFVSSLVRLRPHAMLCYLLLCVCASTTLGSIYGRVQQWCVRIARCCRAMPAALPASLLCLSEHFGPSTRVLHRPCLLLPCHTGVAYFLQQVAPVLSSVGQACLQHEMTPKFKWTWQLWHATPPLLQNNPPGSIHAWVRATPHAWPPLPCCS